MQFLCFLQEEVGSMVRALVLYPCVHSIDNPLSFHLAHGGGLGTLGMQ